MGSAASQLRHQLLGDLLVRDGVVDFINSYDGPGDPERVTEAAAVVGIELDLFDAEIAASVIRSKEPGTHLMRSTWPDPE